MVTEVTISKHGHVFAPRGCDRATSRPGSTCERGAVSQVLCLSYAIFTFLGWDNVKKFVKNIFVELQERKLTARAELSVERCLKHSSLRNVHQLDKIQLSIPCSCSEDQQQSTFCLEANSILGSGYFCIPLALSPPRCRVLTFPRSSQWSLCWRLVLRLTCAFGSTSWIKTCWCLGPLPCRGWGVWLGNQLTSKNNLCHDFKCLSVKLRPFIRWVSVSLFSSTLHFLHAFCMKILLWLQPGPMMPQSSPPHLSHLHIYVQRHRGLVKKTQKSNFAPTRFMVGNTDKLFFSLVQRFLFMHWVMHSNCGPFQSVAAGITPH